MKSKSLIAVILALAVCVSLCGCGADTFDAEKDGILKIITLDKQTKTLSYDIIGTKSRRMETEEFESSFLTILSADSGCFQSSVRDGKVVNEIVTIDLFDQDGLQVAPDEITTAIFTQVAAAHDHTIFALDIIVCEGRYFPVVELNVNLQDPVILYSFNTQTQTMTELYRFDGAVIGGMQLVNPDNLP